MEKFKKFLPFIIVIALTFGALQPLFNPGFFPIHDDEQVGRLYELHQDVLAGHLPPRLSPNLGFGYDYPLFNFYPSFVYYVAEIYHLIGFSFIDSIKLMIGTGFILAAVGMYLLSKSYFGKLGGIVSSVFYTYATYHSIDVYVRGALPEFWAFVFPPFLFWLYTRLADKQRKIYIVAAGFLLACFVLTHHLIVMMTVPFLFFFLLYLLYNTKNKKQFIIAVILSGIIGMGLSAYFWMPSLMEKQYTMIGLLTTELADYAIHYVSPIQFWYSQWGYGGSVEGLGDGISFQIGKIYFLSLFLAFLYGLLLIKKKTQTSVLVLLLVLLFVFSLFMQTEYSAFIWNALQSVMAYIQFPWRFLLLSNFILAFAVGVLFILPFPFIKSKFSPLLHYLAAFIIISMVIYKAVPFFVPTNYLPHAKDSDYVNEDFIKWHTSSLAFEYVPNGIATKKSPKGNTIVDIKESEIEKSPITVVSGKMEVDVLKDIPQQKELKVSVQTKGILQINVYDFPGWKVSIDGKDVSYSGKNKFRLIQVPVEKGEHVINARFTDTPLRAFANTISLLTLLTILSVLIIKKGKRTKTKHSQK